MQCIFGEQERYNCVVYLSAYYIVYFAAPHMWSEQIIPFIHSISVVFP